LNDHGTFFFLFFIFFFYYFFFSQGMSISLQSSLFQQFLWLIKRTYQPSTLRRNRKVGFLGRLGTKGGRDTIARRVAKGRHKVSVACQAVVMEWTKQTWKFF
jgi:ribosomal protein L34